MSKGFYSSILSKPSMEIKLWLPNYLRLNEENKLIWAGESNLPIGTIFHPYYLPTVHTLNFKNPQDIPEKIRQVGICELLTSYFDEKRIPKFLKHSTYLGLILSHLIEVCFLIWYCWFYLQSNLIYSKSCENSEFGIRYSFFVKTCGEQQLEQSVEFFRR